MHKSSTFEYSCNSFLFFLRVREEKKKKNYVIFTCSKCLRPSSSSGSVETLPIPGAPTTGVSTGRRAGLGLGTGGGRMRRGEAVSEGICDRGCWTSGTISTEKKKKNRRKSFNMETLMKKNYVIKLGSLLNRLNRNVNCVMNTAATSYGAVLYFLLLYKNTSLEWQPIGFEGIQKALYSASLCH